jgi:hypothetical protein
MNTEVESSPTHSTELFSGLLPDPAAFVSAASDTCETTPATPVSKRIQELVPSTITPKKLYPIGENDSGKLSLLLTPTAANARNVIYMFREKSTGRTLIGYTETTMRKRAYGYNSAFRSETSDKGKMELPKAVRANPDDFEFGILVEAPEGEELPIGRLEAACIKVKNSVKHGFNQNNGGGGGTKQKPLDPERVEAIAKEVFEQYITPPRTALKKKENDRMASQCTPTTTKARHIVYAFVNRETEERYVGTTSQTFGKRISQHCSNAGCPDKSRGQGPLYDALRDEGENFDVCILYRAKKGDEAGCYEMEKRFIKHYQSNITGYNQNAGGGGGS